MAPCAARLHLGIPWDRERAVVGETRAQMHRSSPERRCGLVAPNPAGSVGRGPKWAPRVGRPDWLRSTSQLKVATMDLGKQQEPQKKGAGRGDALPLAKGEANYPQPCSRIRCLATAPQGAGRETTQAGPPLPGLPGSPARPRGPKGRRREGDPGGASRWPSVNQDVEKGSLLVPLGPPFLPDPEKPQRPPFHSPFRPDSSL